MKAKQPFLPEPKLPSHLRRREDSKHTKPYCQKMEGQSPGRTCTPSRSDSGSGGTQPVEDTSGFRKVNSIIVGVYRQPRGPLQQLSIPYRQRDVEGQANYVPDQPQEQYAAFPCTQNKKHLDSAGLMLILAPPQPPPPVMLCLADPIVRAQLYRQVAAQNATLPLKSWLWESRTRAHMEPISAAQCCLLRLQTPVGAAAGATFQATRRSGPLGWHTSNSDRLAAIF